MGAKRAAREAAAREATPELAGTRCGARHPRAGITCDRTEGHVKSGEPADWHEATLRNTQTEHGTGFETTTDIRQTMRWASHLTEFPPKLD